MPYITQDRINAIANGGVLLSAGELTYAITAATINVVLDSDEFNGAALYDALDQIVGEWLTTRATGPAKYQDYCDALGALLATYMEYKRRTDLKIVEVWNVLSEFIEDFYAEQVGPYEDTKIKQNGDVFPGEVIKRD